MRELNGSHLDLLRNIRDESFAAIERVFGLKKSQVRCFLHYAPTYWHLHVHFVHVNLVNKAVNVGRALLFEDVIDNIEADGAYY